MSFEVILSFLRPIEHLIRDAEISEIMVNGSGRVFVEKHGEIYPIADAEIAEKSLQVAVRNIARILGDEINEDMTLLDAAGWITGCRRPSAMLASRDHPDHQEVSRSTFYAPGIGENRNRSGQSDAMPRQTVEERKNILISGGTGSGKTTMLNALASFIDPNDRVIVIEYTSEIQMNVSNLVEFEARRGQPGQGAVTIRDLLRATLHHRLLRLRSRECSCSS